MFMYLHSNNLAMCCLLLMKEYSCVRKGYQVQSRSGHDVSNMSERSAFLKVFIGYVSVLSVFPS